MNRNIFDSLKVTEPEFYSCHVWRYNPSHSSLFIKAFRDDGANYARFFIGLEGVQSFDGSLRWLGADFNVGSSREIVELVRLRFGTNFDDFSEEQILKLFQLFKFGHDWRKAHIIASNIYVTVEPPAAFLTQE